MKARERVWNAWAAVAMALAILFQAPVAAAATPDFDFHGVRMPILSTTSYIMPAAGGLYGGQGAGTGWVDFIGARNDGTGRLVSQPLPILFPANRLGRDYRLADLNGDGRLDVITNTYDYSCSGNSGFKIFMNDGLDANGVPQFHEDASATALNINGHGETMVIGDFDNDGSLEIFLPYYTFAQYPLAAANYCAPARENVSQNYLLKLGPNGWYSVANTGLEMPGWPASVRPEGAEAIDINGDGLLDLYVGSHLFINQGGLHFVDATQSSGLAAMLCAAETEVNQTSGATASMGATELYYGPVERAQASAQQALETQRIQAAHEAAESTVLQASTASGTCNFQDDNGNTVQGLFDEGAKFVDWYNNGHLSLVVNHPYAGPVIFDFDGTKFTDWRFLLTGTKSLRDAQGNLIKPLFANSYAMNAYDLDNDGRDDIVIAGGDTCDDAIFTNKPSGPRRATVRMGGGDCYAGYPNGDGGITFADINRDGRMDMLMAFANGSTNYFMNATATTGGSIAIDVLDANGLKNQYGRMIQVSPVSNPSVIFTRLVDGGSGYLSQTPYTISVGTPYTGAHTVKVFYGDGTIKTFTAYPGQLVEVYPNQNPTFTTLTPGVMPPVKPTPAYGVGVYRPSTSTFYLRNSSGGVTTIPYGTSGDIPLIGDWNGDGVDTIGVYRPSNSTFYLRNSNSVGPADTIFPMGMTGDIPVVGDWLGYGKMSVGVYRPSTSTFYLRTQPVSGATLFTIPMGANGDKPIIGDWLGNGMPSIGIYRPGATEFFERFCINTTQVGASMLYGTAGDIPLSGDWNGDGVNTIGVFRPSQNLFYLRNSNSPGPADSMIPMGAPSDLPIVGRW